MNDPAGDPSDVGGATSEGASSSFKSSSATKNAKAHEEKGNTIEATTPPLRGEPNPGLPTTKTTAPATTVSKTTVSETTASKTTPATPLETPSLSPEEQIGNLKELAKKLKEKFSKDVKSISSVSFSTQHAGSGFIDCAYRAQSDKTERHVFIDQ